ncbi:MFS transporter, MCP family, solute carrier family 16, member 10 [Lojkania enalia]|uniref:MFS transporter, MCP family, solute carrier family 16, member 10 n=1 Tax=Lojkania enalia TaxID=147567 RepID=A0A9P4KF11_9PLEO|nr:MFS transporter, MCP family, solute carrier family 16, member 10 [Didymosphaeria enalia]
MNTWGFVNSFGAFQTYYNSILPQSPSAISWIGSTQACFMFLLGTFTGRALDAGYFRPTIAIGIVLQIVGVFTMSLAKNYWQLLLSHGICTGVGGGIFFVPVMGLTTTYFAKRRGLAIGIVTTGNSTGGIVYPIVIRQLLSKVGFGWTVRVLGFINVGALAVVLAFMKPRLPPRKAGPIIDPPALKDLPYILHVLGICFAMPSVYTVFYYIASFARDELGMSYEVSLNLVIIVNGIGIPARILPGYVADQFLGVLNTMAICLALNVIMLWAWLGVNSIPSFYVFTVIFGLASASFQSLFPTTIATLSDDLMKTGTRLGMAFTTIAFSALVSGPIAGALLKLGGGYTVPICWASASALVGTCLVVSARCIKSGRGLRIRC